MEEDLIERLIVEQRKQRALQLRVILVAAWLVLWQLTSILLTLTFQGSGYILSVWTSTLILVADGAVLILALTTICGWKVLRTLGNR